MALKGGGADEKTLGEGVSQTQAADGSQENLPFKTSEPIREDQVQNAVKFLSHPKVRGSPVVYRRSFLERKGLTKDEIDEAFNRVPDPPPDATTPDSVATNLATQPRASPNLQPLSPIQPLQPASAQAGAISLPQQRKFNWSYALIAIGVLSASGAGSAVFFKKVVLPRLKAWIRRVAAEGDASEKEDKSSKSLAEETAEAAKAAASAAAIVATASQELLNSKNEDRKCFEAFMGMIDVQVKEMKTMNEAIRNLEKAREQDSLIEEYVHSATVNGTTNNSWKTLQQVKVNGTPNADYGKAMQSLASASMEPTTAPHPKSYMEPWEISQRSFGENVQSQDISSDPWWRNKSVKITELESENEEPSRKFPYSTEASEKPSSQRAWVPPRPPSVALPESAAAIRHPKPSTPIQEQLSDTEKMTPDDGVAAGSSNGNSSVVPNNSEIEEERANGDEVI